MYSHFSNFSSVIFFSGLFVSFSVFFLLSTPPFRVFYNFLTVPKGCFAPITRPSLFLSSPLLSSPLLSSPLLSSPLLSSPLLSSPLLSSPLLSPFFPFSFLSYLPCRRSRRVLYLTRFLPCRSIRQGLVSYSFLSFFLSSGNTSKTYIFDMPRPISTKLGHKNP